MKKIALLLLSLFAFLNSMQCQGTSTKKISLTMVEAFPQLPNFTRPVFFTNDGKNADKVYVVEQQGKIWVFQNTVTVSTRKLFLDITARVDDSGNEMGLLSAVFHPHFAENKYFYVNYTATIGGQRKTVISRFTLSATDSTVADTASEYKILEIDQPYSNHNGGQNMFGSDGYLYIGMGDGGSETDPNGYGQNLTLLLSKILRINVDSAASPLHYSIPSDNPFVGNLHGYREETWAYGMRNPWRFSFDPVTNWLYCGDVGQDAHEEIDIIQKGKNYGWKKTEGFYCYSPSSGCDTTGLTRPIKDYPHSVGNSITGGFVYRGTNAPELVGAYVYADYVTKKVWSLRYDGVTVTDDQLLLTAPASVSSFGVDAHNELYVCTFGNGRIYKFQSPTSVGEGPTGITASFGLLQNFPNPFNPLTVIGYSLSANSSVTLKVYDVLGKEVATLINNTAMEAGKHEVEFNAAGLASGVYYSRLFVKNGGTEKVSAYRTMVLTK